MPHSPDQSKPLLLTSVNLDSSLVPVVGNEHWQGVELIPAYFLLS